MLYVLQHRLDIAADHDEGRDAGYLPCMISDSLEAVQAQAEMITRQKQGVPWHKGQPWDDGLWPGGVRNWLMIYTLPSGVHAAWRITELMLGAFILAYEAREWA